MKLSDPPSKWVLNKDQLEAIGQVAVESTYLELEIQDIIWHLAGLKGANARVMTHRVQMEGRVQLLDMLGKLKIKDAEVLKEFKDLLTQIRVANGLRNQVIHGEWDHGDSGGTIDEQITPVSTWGLISEIRPFPVARKTRVEGAPTVYSADLLADTVDKLVKSRFAMVKFAYAHLDFDEDFYG